MPWVRLPSDGGRTRRSARGARDRGPADGNHRAGSMTKLEAAMVTWFSRIDLFDLPFCRECPIRDQTLLLISNFCGHERNRDAESTTMWQPARERDIVVYGASGFVGALVARHLAAHAPAGTRIALAGRSESRLARVKTELGVDWPIVIADATDAQALKELAASTQVVITTVGPYAKYGCVLPHACAAAGTDYVDLTGEILFARASIDENHELARKTGARIVHSCGFDSIPS